jgi:hypothetical protein
MSTIYRVIDSIMGSGKTTKIIEELRHADTAQSYIVVAPYLTEVDRITEAVPELDFVTPSAADAKTTKLKSFHRLIEAGRNIVSTHALFQRWDTVTLEKLREQGYQLIIDETVDCTRGYGSADGELKPDDIMHLIDTEQVIITEDRKLVWSAKRTPKAGSVFAQLKRDCDAGRIYYMAEDDKDGLMFWEFPIELLNAFESVTILTYLFSGSLMSAYLEGHEVTPDRMTIDVNHNLVPWSEELQAEAVRPIASLINLLDDEKLNAVGDKSTALANGWLSRQSPKQLKAIATTTRNVLSNRFGARWATAMWSCVKTYEDALCPTDFKKGHVPCNARATNEYRDRSHLAYLRNIYMFPTIWQFYKVMRGVEPSHDEYALAELLQWVFRSAIRDGKPIDLYLPSSRMRDLLNEWMKSGKE